MTERFGVFKIEVRPLWKVAPASVPGQQRLEAAEGRGQAAHKKRSDCQGGPAADLRLLHHGDLGTEHHLEDWSRIKGSGEAVSGHMTKRRALEWFLMGRGVIFWLIVIGGFVAGLIQP